MKSDSMMKSQDMKMDNMKSEDMKSDEIKVKEMLKQLFYYYLDNIEYLPPEYKYLINEKGENKEQVVCDYIAGMSDQYSVAAFKKIFIPNYKKINQS